MLQPPHAYIPSQTTRHPEGAFDVIRDTVADGMDAETMAESLAFQRGLAWLEEGYYWEAHEVLEPVWMACLPNSAERHFVQGLIQLANARLKLLMQQPKAASRLFAIAAGHLTDAARASSGRPILGCNVKRFIDACGQRNQHNNA